MKEAVSNIKNDKAFCLYIFFDGPKKKTKQYHYPNLNMELLLSKINEHINGRVTDEKLQQMLKEIANYNGDVEIKLKQIEVYIFEVSAEDLYKPRSFMRE